MSETDSMAASETSCVRNQVSETNRDLSETGSDNLCETSWLANKHPSDKLNHSVIVYSGVGATDRIASPFVTAASCQQPGQQQQQRVQPPAPSPPLPHALPPLVAPVM